MDQHEHDEHEHRLETDREPRRYNWLAYLLTGALALGLAATGWWGYQQYKSNAAYRMQAENNYQRAFGELVGHVDNLEMQLAKTLASNGSQVVASLDDTWKEAYAAHSSLSQLPMATNSLTQTSGFLNTTGDYAYTLSRKKITDQKLSDEEFKNLDTLHKQSQIFHGELVKMAETFGNTNLTWTNLEKEMRAREAAGQGQRQTVWWNKVWAVVAGQGQPQVPPIVKNFEFVESELQKYAPIQYDGRGSATIRIKPRMITGETINRDRALQIAGDFLGKEGVSNQTLQLSGESNGEVPTYNISAIDAKNPGQATLSMDVSKTGGHVIYMLKTRGIGDKTIDRAKAEQLAAEFLRSKGYKEFEITTSQEYNNLAIVTATGKQGEVLCLPDQLKVRVALDNGEIVGYDAAQYLTFHQQRKNAKPQLTKDEAKAKVTKRMDMTSQRMVILAKDNYEEISCWEFRGKRNNEEYLVYINAKDGKEEKVYRVITTPNGKFQM